MDTSTGPIQLDQIRVARPCSLSWASMEGTERVRHCGQCALNVYNISEMSGDEAVNLIREREGRVCVRCFRHHDGTIITRNCPSRFRKLRRAVLTSLALFIGSLGIASATIFRDDLRAQFEEQHMGVLHE